MKETPICAFNFHTIFKVLAFSHWNHPWYCALKILYKFWLLNVHKSLTWQIICVTAQCLYILHVSAKCYSYIFSVLSLDVWRHSVPRWVASRVVVLQPQVSYFPQREGSGQEEHVAGSSLKHRLVGIGQVVDAAFCVWANQLQCDLQESKDNTDLKANIKRCADRKCL